MSRRQRFVITIASIAALVVTPALPAAADEEPAANTAPAGSDLLVDPQLAARQDRLMQLRTWIVNQPGIEDSGYIESVNDAANLSTTVLWFGPVSALQDGIRKEAKRLGVSVAFKQRKHSRKQLIAAANAASRSKGKGAFAGFAVYSIGAIGADFDGIELRGDHIDTPVGGRAALDVSAARSMSAQLGVDVSIIGGGGGGRSGSGDSEQRYTGVQRRRLDDVARLRHHLHERLRHHAQRIYTHDNGAALCAKRL